jgi:MFS family permease
MFHMTTYLQTLRLFNRNVQLCLITAAVIGFTIDGGVYAVLFNLYLLRLGYGPEFVGLINSAGMLTFALCSLPAGILGKRWGNRPMMILGLTLMLVGCGLLPLAEFAPAGWRPAWLVVTYVLNYLGVAMYFVNLAPFLMGAAGPAERNHVFSVQVALLALAAFAGSLIGGLLPGLFSTLLGVSPDQPVAYRYPLWLAAGLLIPAILAVQSTHEVNPTSEPGHTVKPNIDQPEALSFSLIARLTLVRLFQVAGVGATATFFNVYLDAGLQIPTAQIGFLAAFARLTAVPAALILPFLTARWGNNRIVVFATLGTALMILPLALISHWSAVGLGFMGVITFSSIRYAAFLVYSMELVPPRWRGTLSGAGEMAAGFSFAGIALGGGYIITSLGYTSLFLIGAGLTIIGALLFWVYFPTPRNTTAGVRPS